MEKNNNGAQGTPPGVDNQESYKRYFWERVNAFMKDKFDLDADKGTQHEVIENIDKGVEFKGTNLWILIFATFVASLGLNVNSTAVIIGAMLISPLMGPIMGIGLSLGINNFEMMKRSLKNFGFMIVVSITTATVYFWLSPLSDATSELLARTSPTIYDVLIAFFGGLAGIVAQSRKDRTSIVIPGVAIATALMPPLCTAGYGLGTGQLNFFFGAFYLFFINTVFIALATYIIVRFLNYDKKVFLDKARERKVKNYMVIIVVVTAVPSIFMAYSIIQKSIFDNNADRFVSQVFRFENTQVIDVEKKFRDRDNDNRSHIDLLLIGDRLPQMVIDNATGQLEDYGLLNTDLRVRQSEGGDKIDINTLQISYTKLLDEKNRRIGELEERLTHYTADTLALADIAMEAGAVFDNVASVFLSRQDEYDVKGEKMGKVLVCIVKPKNPAKGIDVDKLSRWLAVRTRCSEVKVYVEKGK